MKRRTPTHRRRSETDQFRLALARLRREKKWNQETLAMTLGVSKRTLSNWECGYWLPPFKQRLHIVLALRDAPPEYVLEVADGLGVSADPAVAPLLQPYIDALEGSSAPAEPPRPRPTPEALRGAVDAVVREAADTMNVAANDLRAAIGRALGVCAELGGTLEETRQAVAVGARKGKGG